MTDSRTQISFSTKKSRTDAQRAAGKLFEAVKLLQVYGGTAEQELAGPLSRFADELYRDALRAERKAEGLCLDCGLPSPDSEYCARCAGGVHELDIRREGVGMFGACSCGGWSALASETAVREGFAEHARRSTQAADQTQIEQLKALAAEKGWTEYNQDSAGIKLEKWPTTVVVKASAAGRVSKARRQSGAWDEPPVIQEPSKDKFATAMRWLEED